MRGVSPKSKVVQHQGWRTPTAAAATMGCTSSKSTEGAEAGSADGAAAAQKAEANVDRASKDSASSQASSTSTNPEGRLSVRYQAKELDRKTGSSRRSSATFDKSKIGTATKHGISPGPGGRGAAKINQDRGAVCYPFNGSYNEALLCVFDGHGRLGEKASEFCMTTVPELLEADHELLASDPSACLTKNVIETDKKLLGGSLGRIAMNCGTTSTVCYMRGNELWVACSGDSRAVKGARVGGKIVATDLSTDHKPDSPGEMQRILAAGGQVTAPTV